MKVLLSIKPEYAEKIFSGLKRFEFRKAVFRNPAVKTVVLYATKPVGKVLGEFDIEEILAEEPNTLWSMTSKFAGIPKQFFNEYFRGRHTAYAIRVREARRYNTPLDLNVVLGSSIAPQSFCYIAR
jgi:predicted transcriptional regulator